jgi:hypothetical protein
MLRDQDRLRRARVNTRDTRRPRTPSIGSIRSCDRPSLLTKRIVSMKKPRAPFSRPSAIRRVNGLRSCPNAIPDVNQHDARWMRKRFVLSASGRDAFPQSLQPTRNHEYPRFRRFPSVELSLFQPTLPSPRRHLPARLCERRRRRFSRRRRAPLPVSSTPGGDANWRRDHQLRVSPSSRQGGQAGPAQDRRPRIRRCDSRMVRSLTFPVTHGSHAIASACIAVRRGFPPFAARQRRTA